MRRTLILLTLSCLFLLNINAQEKLAADTTKTRLIWSGEKLTEFKLKVSLLVKK